MHFPKNLQLFDTTAPDINCQMHFRSPLIESTTVKTENRLQRGKSGKTFKFLTLKNFLLELYDF